MDKEESKYEKLLEGDISGYESIDLALIDAARIYIENNPTKNHRADLIYSWIRLSKLWRKEWNQDVEGKRAWVLSIINKVLPEYQSKQTEKCSGPSANSIFPVSNDPSCSTSINFPDGKVENVHLTDTGNGRRFAVAANEDFKYSPGLAWHHWGGKIWEANCNEAVFQLAKKVALSIYEKRLIVPEKEGPAYGKWGLQTESEHKIKAMIELAKTESAICVGEDVFDRDPMLFNVLNGTIDLKTGILMEHKRENYITMLAPVEYIPGADCPHWKEHLNTIFNADAEMISCLQIGLGYSLTGLTDEQKMFIPFGVGANGKSLTLDTISMLAGGYASSVRIDTLTYDSKGMKNDNATLADLASLRKKRLVTSMEPEAGRRLAESTIKQLTGQDSKVKAKLLYQNMFEYTPEFKIWLSTNHRLIIKGQDEAIWRRIVEVPFEVTIPPENRIHRDTLLRKFRAELPGILNWLLEGVKDWRFYRLFLPDKVKRSVEDYRNQMNPVTRFIEDCCVLDAAAEVLSTELYEKYRDYCGENGSHELSHTNFSLRLSEKGLQKIHAREGNKWIGIKLGE